MVPPLSGATANAQGCAINRKGNKKHPDRKEEVKLTLLIDDKNKILRNLFSKVQDLESETYKPTEGSERRPKQRDGPGSQVGRLTTIKTSVLSNYLSSQCNSIKMLGFFFFFVLFLNRH